jgi:hypothetical protein
LEFFDQQPCAAFEEEKIQENRKPSMKRERPVSRFSPQLGLSISRSICLSGKDHAQVPPNPFHSSARISLKSSPPPSAFPLLEILELAMGDPHLYHLSDSKLNQKLAGAKFTETERPGERCSLPPTTPPPPPSERRRKLGLEAVAGERRGSAGEEEIRGRKSPSKTLNNSKFSKIRKSKAIEAESQ